MDVYGIKMYVFTPFV